MIWQEPELHRPRRGFNDFRRAYIYSTVASKAIGIGAGTAATAGIAAAAFAAEMLLKHYIGQGRRAADAWVSGASGQNQFQKNVLEQADILAQSDPDKARALVQEAWKSYLQAADTYASKGSSQAKVIQQNLSTPAFMSSVQARLGGDPLGDEYTAPFMGKVKDVGGSILSGARTAAGAVGSAVGSAIGKIITAVKTPKVGPTPPYTPGGTIPATGQNPSSPQEGVGWGQLAAEVGASLGTSWLGSKLGQVKPTENEQAVISNALEAQKLGMQTGKSLLGMGQEAITPALRYQQAILGGDRSKMTAALAPDIQRIGQGYQAASQSAAALNPRGGPSVGFLSELPYQQQRDVSTLMQTARPAAATALMGAGQNLLSAGTNAIYGTTGPGQNILQQQEEARKIEAERGKAIGGGLYSTFQKYGMPALQKQWPNIFGQG